MSMILELHAISDEGIRLLLERPERITRFLFGEPDPAPPAPPPGLLSRLFGSKPAPPPPPPEPLPAELDKPKHEVVDLDKSWHGMHFLLTGAGAPEDEVAAAADPAQWLLYGGAYVGEVDVGYGPARALRAAEVRRWSEYLDQQDPAVLRGRFSPAEMTAQGVYPDIWDRDPAEDDTLGYVMESFEPLREFLRERVKAGEGVLVRLC